MADQEVQSWNRFLEIGCKLYLFFTGLSILLFSLLFFVTGPMVFGETGLVVFVLWVGTFVWAFYWYLRNTEGGLRLLGRMWTARRGLAKIRCFRHG